MPRKSVTRRNIARARGHLKFRRPRRDASRYRVIVRAQRDAGYENSAYLERVECSTAEKCKEACDSETRYLLRFRQFTFDKLEIAQDLTSPHNRYDRRKRTENNRRFRDRRGNVCVSYRMWTVEICHGDNARRRRRERREKPQTVYSSIIVEFL